MAPRQVGPFLNRIGYEDGSITRTWPIGWKSRKGERQRRRLYSSVNGEAPRIWLAVSFAPRSGHPISPIFATSTSKEFILS